MNFSLADYATSPLRSPLGVGAIAFIMFGLFFLALWWRDRDYGLNLIGLSILLVAGFYSAETLGLVPRPGVVYGPVWVSSTLETANILLALGLAQYIDPKHWRTQPLMWIAIAPQAALLVLGFAGVALPRVLGNYLLASSPPVMALMVWWAGRREPGAGHELVGASLMLLPVAVFMMPLLHIDVVYARYVSVPARITFYMTLLVVCMHRRRKMLEEEVQRRKQSEQALAESNALLERRVEDRTAQLRDMVDGLESFNRNVSHDLRAPLFGIEGLAGRTRADIAEGREIDVQRMLSLIETQAHTSRQLVAALLELARVGNSALAREPVQLDRMIASVVDDLRLQDATPASFPTLQVEALPQVMGDPGLLRLVFVNLIGNAAKFSRKGAAAHVAVGSVQQLDEIQIYVKDNGPGFAPEQSDKLFQPFQRLHAGFDGHGIGLSIVRRVIERHGGRVWAEGVRGGGATFWFALPRGQASAFGAHATSTPITT